MKIIFVDLYLFLLKLNLMTFLLQTVDAFNYHCLFMLYITNKMVNVGLRESVL